MGYMRHHAIVVTSWNNDLIKEAHEKAKGLCSSVSNITEVVINGYSSFFVAPDGSKEWWEDSDKGDCARNSFVEWLNSKRYEDGPSLAWVEVQYGDDEGETKIIRHSDEALQEGEE